MRASSFDGEPASELLDGRKESGHAVLSSYIVISAFARPSCKNHKSPLMQAKAATSKVC